MTVALYEGVVEHVRLRPRAHRLSLSVMMAALDLGTLADDLDAAGRLARFPRAPVWFRRADHHGAAIADLAEATRRLVENRLGFRPEGRITLLTQLGSYGLRFNPVSFYHCEDRAGRRVAIVSEVNNTPWGERHCYVHDARGTDETVVDTFDKVFHVSPFNPLEQRYVWRFGRLGEQADVAMSNLDDDGPLFHATMHLRRAPLDARSLTRLLTRHAFQSARILAAIYAHAGLLRLRGVPYVPHPDDHRRRSARARAAQAAGRPTDLTARGATP